MENLKKLTLRDPTDNVTFLGDAPNQVLIEESTTSMISDDNFIILGSPANAPESDAGYALKPEMKLPVSPDIGLLAYIPKSNDPSSASNSQLFITLGNPGPEAPAQYSFFGKITGGLEALKRLTTTSKTSLASIVSKLEKAKVKGESSLGNVVMRAKPRMQKGQDIIRHSPLHYGFSIAPRVTCAFFCAGVIPVTPVISMPV